MKILKYMRIRKLFSEIKHSANVFQCNGFEYRKALYYCADCTNSFAVDYRYQGPLRGYGDQLVICPHCGAQHSRYGRYVPCYVGENEAAPLSMNINVVEYKHHISLQVFTRTVRFSELHHALTESTEEIFRFDVKSRKTTWTQKVGRRLKEELELGNPFDLQVTEKSLLRFLNTDSCDEAQRKDLNLLLKILRETIQRKLEKACGHKTKSFFVNSGKSHGRVLIPVFNIAYRMVFLDAPNLPAQYRTFGVSNFWSWRMLLQSDIDRFADLRFFRKNTNCITALIEKYELLNVPSIRKILQADFFAFKVLAYLVKIDTDVNFIAAGYQLMIDLVPKSSLHLYDEESQRDFQNFCVAMRETYGSTTVLRLLKKIGEQDYSGIERDIYRMYNQLAPKNKALARSVKFKDLHDWLAVKISEQETIGYDFDVPEVIRKRLMMQKDAIGFYLPKHSKQLKHAGLVMHNCVASYSERMLSNELQIVLVSDDKGKLVACLEICDDNLVQAKLRFNKSAFCDEKINAEILEWAQKAKIRVDRCGDVRTKPRKVHLPAVIPTAV